MVEVIDLFESTKKVLAEYTAENDKLEEREEYLKNELASLQEQHTAILIDTQNTEEIGERIYLAKQAKETVTESEVLMSMLEAVAEEKKDLKVKYVPILKKATQTDRELLGDYSATEIVKKHRQTMLTQIADIGTQMQNQYYAIAPDVLEILGDSEVKEVFHSRDLRFEREEYRPSFVWFTTSVVSKQDVFSAASGFLPEDLKKLKKDVG